MDGGNYDPEYKPRSCVQYSDSFYPASSWQLIIRRFLWTLYVNGIFGVLKFTILRTKIL